MNETYDHPTSSVDPTMHAIVAHSGILAEPTQSQARRNRQFSWCLNVAYVFLRGVQGLVSCLDRACFLLCEFDALVLFLILTGCPQKAVLPNKLRQAVLEQSLLLRPIHAAFAVFHMHSLSMFRDLCSTGFAFFQILLMEKFLSRLSKRRSPALSAACQEPIRAFVRTGMPLLSACSCWICGAFNVMLKFVLAWLLQLALISLL